jgi:Ca2+-binding EF-hand superfamily protein
LDSKKIKAIINNGNQQFVEEIKDGRGKLTGSLITEDLKKEKEEKKQNTFVDGYEVPVKKEIKEIKDEFEMPKRKKEVKPTPVLQVVEEVFEMPKKKKPIVEEVKNVVPKEEPKALEEEEKKPSFSLETRFKNVSKPKIVPQSTPKNMMDAPIVHKHDASGILDQPVPTLKKKDSMAEKTLKKQFLSSRFNMTAVEQSGSNRDDREELEEFIASQGIKVSSKNFTTDKSNIAALFQKFDELGYGTLDGVSIRALLLHLGFPMYKKYIDVIVRLMDDDCSDSIDFDEFSEWWILMASHGFETLVSKTEKLYKMWDLFSAADEDMSGFLEFEECKTLFPVLVEECGCRKDEFDNTEMTHEDVLRMMYEIDENGDGRISFPELVKLMKLYE